MRRGNVQENMDDSIKEKLQGCILGYCYRQKVVQETRAQYEQLVLEIQKDTVTSSAKEIITWPSQLALCYPVFKGSTSEVNTSIDKSLPVSNPQVSNQGPLCAVSEEKMEKGGEVFKNLPKDRESLLELRSKLGMELVWLQQAISSRQKYIQVKKELETSPLCS